MAFGAGVFSLTVGNISSLFAAVDTRSSNLAFKMTTLNEFCRYSREYWVTIYREAKISNELRSKFRKALEYSHRKNIFSWIDKQKIFNELPAQLKCEVALNMYNGVIKKISFLNNKGSTFIALVVPMLQPLSTQPREIIFRKQDLPNSMFFLIEGRVSFLLKLILPFKTMVSGSYFGESDIIFKRRRTLTARSDKYSLHSL